MHPCKHLYSINACNGMDKTALITKHIELVNLEAGRWRTKSSILSKPELYANLTEQQIAYAQTEIWSGTE